MKDKGVNKNDSIFDLLRDEFKDTEYLKTKIQEVIDDGKYIDLDIDIFKELNGYSFKDEGYRKVFNIIKNP